MPFGQYRGRPRAGCPDGGLQGSGQLRQVLRIKRVRLGAAQLCLGEVVRLQGIDDTDMVARRVQGDGEGDPVTAGRFEDDERGGGRAPRRSQLALQGGKPLRRLGMGDGRGGRSTGWHPRGGEACRRDVNPDVQLVIGRLVLHLFLHCVSGWVMRQFSGRWASCLVMRGPCHSIRFRLAAPRKMGDTLWDAVVAAWAPASSPSSVNRSL